MIIDYAMIAIGVATGVAFAMMVGAALNSWKGAAIAGGATFLLFSMMSMYSYTYISCNEDAMLYRHGSIEGIVVAQIMGDEECDLAEYQNISTRHINDDRFMAAMMDTGKIDDAVMPTILEEVRSKYGGYVDDS